MKIRDRIVELRRVKAADLIPNPRNWRKHPKAQADALRGVLAEVGYADALLARQLPDGSLMLVDGHLRAETTPDAEVPVLVLDVTEAEADKILLTLDPLAAMADADTESLRSLLADVSTEDDAVRKMLADLSDEAGIEKPVVDAPEARIDDADELRKKWGVERGQLWRIGGHRLLCGDSTSAEDVGRLMGGERAGCVLTDPPYGQDQAGVPHDSPAELTGNIDGAVACLPVDDAIAVIFQSPRTFPVLLDSMRRAGWTFERMLWLYKVAQCAYPWRGWILISESILVFTKGEPVWAEVHPYVHDIYRLAEVSGELPQGSGWHGSVKPLAVVVDILSRIGGDVFDPFAGSGTTFVAAEQLHRRCFGMEIEPKYVAVALQRLSDMGLTPERVDG